MLVVIAPNDDKRPPPKRGSRCHPPRSIGSAPPLPPASIAVQFPQARQDPRR